MPLIAGDDYQLCFTVSPEKAALVPETCQKIGIIEAQHGLRLNKSGNIHSLKVKGYEHFS
jgi:thiamine-monophosphate kinase